MTHERSKEITSNQNMNTEHNESINTFESEAGWRCTDAVTMECRGTIKVHILKRFALSPRLFSKATEIKRRVSEGVSPISYIDTWFICHSNYKNTLENLCHLNRSLLKQGRCSGEVFPNMDDATQR